MKKLFLTSVLLVGTAVSGLALSLTNAAAIPINITVDENGNGRLTNFGGATAPLPVSLASDPGPGGLANALTYGLLNPPDLVAGDLLLLEPRSVGVLSDLIRFNPTEGGGSLVFYSDNSDGVDSRADIGLPIGVYADNLVAFEVGPEGNNGFIYTPLQGQPGFISGTPVPLTYDIISDSTVPLPSTWLMLLAGFAGFGFIGFCGAKQNSARAVATA